MLLLNHVLGQFHNFIPYFPFLLSFLLSAVFHVILCCHNHYSPPPPILSLFWGFQYNVPLSTCLFPFHHIYTAYLNFLWFQNKFFPSLFWSKAVGYGLLLTTFCWILLKQVLIRSGESFHLSSSFQIRMKRKKLVALNTGHNWTEAISSFFMQFLIS